MTVNVPSRTTGEVIDHASEMVEEGVSAAAEHLGSLAERMADLQLERELRAAGGRVADGAENVLEGIDAADARDRSAMVAVAALVVALIVIILVLARRRRGEDRATGSDAGSVHRPA